MKKIIVVSVILFICLLMSCSDDPINPTTIKKYPDSLGTEWEYTTTFTLLFYDSAGTIYGNDTLFIGNTIANIINDNDSLGSNKNLVLFSSYDEDTPQSNNYIWYSNTDDGMYAIAVSGPASSQPILPKSIPFPQNSIFEKIFNLNLTPISLTHSIIFFDDSLQYYDPVRKVLLYPLRVGKSWTETNSPFIIKRTVKTKKEVITQAGKFYCYLVETEIEEFPNITYEDFIDLDAGLVFRKIKVDSMAHTTELGDTLGFFNSTSLSELIRRN